MKSLTLFCHVILDELGMMVGTSTLRDRKTVTERIEHEGISFLTITLPQFARDFERSLEQTWVTDDLFAGFSRKGELPKFLGGFLDKVFDRGTGRLWMVLSAMESIVDNGMGEVRATANAPTVRESIEAIKAIRQFTLMFAKIDLPCSDARTSAALDQYLSCEREVTETSAAFLAEDLEKRTLFAINALEAYFGIERFHDVMLPFIEVAQRLTSDPNTDLDLLLMDLEETRSSFRQSGPNV
jgi:hypothetical protein